MQVLCQAHDFTKMHLTCAVQRFRVGMKALAEFFSCLHASVQRIERTAATIEGMVQQSEYKNRYESMLSQRLVTSCCIKVIPLAVST